MDTAAPGASPAGFGSTLTVALPMSPFVVSDKPSALTHNVTVSPIVVRSLQIDWNWAAGMRTTASGSGSGTAMLSLSTFIIFSSNSARRV